MSDHPSRFSAAIEFVAHQSLEIFGGEEVFKGCCDRARDEDGVPIDRAALNFQHLHPQYLGSAFYWRSDDRALRLRRFGVDEILQYRDTRNAITVVIDGDVDLVEQRLDQPVQGPEYDIYQQLRIEGLCRALGRRLLVSSAFAAAVDDRGLVPLGAHALKGVAAPIAVYGLDDEEPRP